MIVIIEIIFIGPTMTPMDSSTGDQVLLIILETQVRNIFSFLVAPEMNDLQAYLESYTVLSWCKRRMMIITKTIRAYDEN